MAFPLRQSTASQEVPLGPFLDIADANTEETGITLSASEILVWKSGATSLVAKNSGDATHMQNGIFYAVLDATDTNTIGPLVIFARDTAALWVRLECVVYDEAVYDALFGTTALSTYAGGAVASVTGNVGGNVAGSVGSVTAGVTLADDAITAAKYDESTAFPLKSNDAGSTQVARVGADGDTLETLSDQLDTRASATALQTVDDEIDAIRDRLSVLPTKTGAVVDDASNSASTFETDLTESADDHYKDCLLKFVSGSLAEQVKKITAYNGTTKFITVEGGFTAEPADGDDFEIVNE